MAKTCFLCGGPLKDGRCTECGLDNNKNDKRYQLNTHNDAGAHFHSGDCEDQLNRERRQKKTKKKKKKQEEQKPETFNYREMLEEEKKKVHSVSAGKGKNGGKASGPAASGSGKKKKKHGIFWWIVIIYILFGLISSFMESSTDALDGFRDMWETVTDSFESRYEEEPADNYEADPNDPEENYGSDGNGVSPEDPNPEEIPEKVAYDVSSPQYYEAELEPGVYTIGYDIPAGVYQFHLEDEEYATAMITWYEKEDSELIYLCSEIVRTEYWEDYQEEYPFGEYSSELVLKDGEQFYVENSSANGLQMSGLMKERSILKKRAAQAGLQEVVIDSGDESLICGESFAPGVYDMIAEGEYPYAYVTLTSENGVLFGRFEEYGISFASENPLCRRIPLEEGTEILVEYLAEDGQLRLVPSY